MFKDFDLRVWNRLQVWLTHLVGLLIGFLGIGVFISFWLKTCYENNTAIFFGISGRAAGAFAYNHIGVVRLIWDWIPSANATLAGLLLSVPFAAQVCAIIVGVGVIAYARQGNEVINDVLKSRRIARKQRKHGRTDNGQSVENIRAGRDVVIRQEITEERLSEWENGWVKIVGGIGATVVASVVAAVITQWTGLTH